MAAGRVSVTDYPARRLTIAVSASFEDFRQRYEAAVPRYDAAAFAALVERKAGWAEMLDLMNNSAPYGFLIYGTIDAQPLMSLAGDRAPCVAYLMGNHTIAERMFRHDPRALLYAPLRTVLTSGDDGGAQFCLDQPSQLFRSFDDPRITAVGVELDRKVATLLEHLGAPVPSPLRG